MHCIPIRHSYGHRVVQCWTIVQGTQESHALSSLFTAAAHAPSLFRSLSADKHRLAASSKVSPPSVEPFTEFAR